MMTRSAPAKLLGLAGIGTLAPGAIADVVVYEDQPNREKMFASPKIMIRRGKVLELSRHHSVANDSSPIHNTEAQKVTHTVRPSFDSRSLDKLSRMHAESSSFRMDRLWISDDELANQIGSQPVVHPCVARRDEAVSSCH